MPHELKNLDLQEVSLVDEPANPGAKVLLIKRIDRRDFVEQFRKAITAAGADAAPLDAVVKDAIDFDEAQENREAMDVFWRSFDALHESVMSIINDEETSDKSAAISTSLEQFAASVREQLAKAKDGRNHQVGGNSMSEKDAAKRLEGLEKTVESLTKVLTEMGAKVEKKEDGGYTIEKPAPVLVAKDAVEALSEAGVTVKKADDGKIAVEIAKKPDPDDGKTDLEKALDTLPEPVRKQIEADRKRAEDNAKAIAKMEDERETEAISKRISESFGDVLPAAEFAPVLKKLGEADKEGLEKLETRLKALQEQLAKSALFKEIGGTGGGGDEDAIGKVEDLAKARATEKSISIFKARTEIRKENPELAAEERKQRDEAKKAA